MNCLLDGRSAPWENLIRCLQTCIVPCLVFCFCLHVLGFCTFASYIYGTYATEHFHIPQFSLFGTFNLFNGNKKKKKPNFVVG